MMKIKGMLLGLLLGMASCVFAQSSTVATQTATQNSFLHQKIEKLQQNLANVTSQVTLLVQKNNGLQDRLAFFQQKLHVMKQEGAPLVSQPSTTANLPTIGQAGMTLSLKHSLYENKFNSHMVSIIFIVVIISVLLIVLLIAILYNMSTKLRRKNTAKQQLEHQTLLSIAGESVNDTKLDLARAYIDMDEIDNAKILLNEVLSQGDAGQKDEAKTLLDELTK